MAPLRYVDIVALVLQRIPQRNWSSGISDTRFTAAPPSPSNPLRRFEDLSYDAERSHGARGEGHGHASKHRQSAPRVYGSQLPAGRNA